MDSPVEEVSAAVVVASEVSVEAALAAVAQAEVGEMTGNRHQSTGTAARSP